MKKTNTVEMDKKYQSKNEKTNYVEMKKTARRKYRKNQQK